MIASIKRFLINSIYRIVAPIKSKIAHDLEYELSLDARKSSAKYLSLNMGGVPAFKDRNSLIEQSLSMVSTEGLYHEFGVFKGDSISYIAKKVPRDTMIHGFDSFSGLPEFWRPGYNKTIFDLRENLPKVPLNVSLYKGWFNETLPVFVSQYQELVVFVHIDCDLYSSTKTIFEVLSHRLSPGCIVVFDEYFNHPGWQQDEFKAFHEFLEHTGRKYEYIGYVRNNEQVAVRIA